MQRVFSVVVLLLMLAVPSFAEAPASPEPPVVAEIDQLRLKVLVQDLTIKQLTYQQMQNQLQQLQTEFEQAQKNLQTIINEVYKKAGLKQEEYELDMQTFRFSKISKRDPAKQ